MSDETMTDTEESLYNEGFQQGLEEADPAETQVNPQEQTQEVTEGSDAEKALAKARKQPEQKQPNPINRPIRRINRIRSEKTTGPICWMRTE